MGRIFGALILLSSTALAHSASFDHRVWNDLLQQHVTILRHGQATRVEYRAFLADRSTLKGYLTSASEVPRNTFDRWPQAEQLAFLINVYNAWTIELVLTHYPGIESIKEVGSLLQSPWKQRFIPLFGGVVSLDDIEHRWLRNGERYRDPRIHFAVNCASIGCPALRWEAYVADRLDQQLDHATERFLADRERNRLESGHLQISSIFKWYRGDFERGWRGYTSLQQFLIDHGDALGLDPASERRLSAGELTIEFLEYDWRLNDVPIKPGAGV